MNQLEAIKYLVEHSVYGDEWSGAGMWEAVLKVMKTKGGRIKKSRLDELIEDAEKF